MNFTTYDEVIKLYEYFGFENTQKLIFASVIKIDNIYNFDVNMGFDFLNGLFFCQFWREYNFWKSDDGERSKPREINSKVTLRKIRK